MSMELVYPYAVTCDRDKAHKATVFVRDRDPTTHVEEQLRERGWRIGEWIVATQEYEHICPACVAAEKHEKAGPWCDESHWEGKGPYDFEFRDGRLFCLTCGRRVVLKPPGVYC